MAGCSSVPAEVGALCHTSKGPRRLLALPAWLEGALSPRGLYLMGALPASPSWERAGLWQRCSPRAGLGLELTPVPPGHLMGRRKRVCSPQPHGKHLPPSRVMHLQQLVLLHGVGTMEGLRRRGGGLIPGTVGATRQPLAQWSCGAAPGTASARSSSGSAATAGTLAAAGCRLGRGGRNDGPSQQR